MSKIITAVFDTRVATEAALLKLDQAGFTKDHVTMMASEETRGMHFGIEAGNKADEGAVSGAAIGGLVGALYAGMTTAGALAIPGLNLVVSGAVIGALAGLGTGAVTGGLVGALVGLGVPENEAKLYEDTIRKGAILIAVTARTDQDAKTVETVLKNTHAKNITALAA